MMGFVKYFLLSGVYRYAPGLSRPHLALLIVVYIRRELLSLLQRLIFLYVSRILSAVGAMPLSRYRAIDQNLVRQPEMLSAMLRVSITWDTVSVIALSIVVEVPRWFDALYKPPTGFQT